MATGGVSRRAFLAGSLTGGALVAVGLDPWVRLAAGLGGGDDNDSGRRFLRGNYAPVDDELDVADLAVEGTIPAALNGHLLRVGPNPIDANPATYHWFLGDGMVHSVELRDGAASYRNRWVRTDDAAAKLGEQPRPGQPESVNLIHSAANTALVAHGGHVLALYEVSLPTEITVDLDTIGTFDYGGALGSPMTAHPKVDPATGELLFFGLDIFGPPFLRFHVADATGAITQTHEIGLDQRVMMHDFAITETRAVFLDLPVVYDFNLVGKRPLPAAWDPDYTARVGVVLRANPGTAEWVEIDPCFVFHTLNAYDDGDRVVLDVVRHEKVFDRDPTGFDEGGPRPWLERWTIDTQAGQVAVDRLDDRGQEFPRVAPRVVGKPHRFGYSTLVRSRTSKLGTSGVVKHDLRDGTAEVAGAEEGIAWSEAIFVPDPEGTAEDDGWVLGIVYDAARDGSDLVILDAADFAGEPVARVRMPRRVPFGFHGTWVPS
ncbi:MAG: carotenoid oxygenase family protein [Actinomycetota bacterium]